LLRYQGLAVVYYGFTLVLQNLNYTKSNLLNRSYGLNIPIPRCIFNEDYPINPKSFGEKLRKARMDAGLKIKELANLVGVSENTVINWELREMRPWRKDIRKKVNQFIEN